jgi:hypothetical protein
MRSEGRKLPVVRKFENHRVNVREQIAAPFSDPYDIARAQLVRFRRRLGTLTCDQELQIENLLISTVTKVSLMTGRLMELLGREIL